MHNQSRTVAGPFTLEGLGLHGNGRCSVTVSPAASGGLRFLHAASGVEIPASAEFADAGGSLSTSLSRRGARVRTVEHLLSALSGMGVDHALATVEGDELPILDGSAGPWARAIEAAGLVDAGSPRARIRVLREVRVDWADSVDQRVDQRIDQRGGRRIRVLPPDPGGGPLGLAISYTIDFPCPSIGRQTLDVSIAPGDPGAYMRGLADARTFCMKRDVEAMRAAGLALGGSLENAAVYDDDRCLSGPLRFPDEAVRHKALDLVGDLALLGAPLAGRVEAFAAGHAMHIELAKKLLASPGAWALETAAEAGEPRPAWTQGRALLQTLNTA